MRIVMIESCGKFEFFHNYLWNSNFSYETEVLKGSNPIQIKAKNTSYVIVDE